MKHPLHMKKLFCTFFEDEGFSHHKRGSTDSNFKVFGGLLLLLAMLCGGYWMYMEKSKRPVPDEMMVLLDLSGSMAGGNLNKAKESITHRVSALPYELKVGLRSFSDGTKEEHKLSAGNRDGFIIALQGLVTIGGSVMSKGMSALKDDFSPEKSKKLVLLATDGDVDAENTIAAAKELKKKYGDDIVGLIVGLERNPAGNQTLEEVARILNGRYLNGFDKDIDGILDEAFWSIEKELKIVHQIISFFLSGFLIYLTAWMLFEILLCYEATWRYASTFTTLLLPVFLGLSYTHFFGNIVTHWLTSVGIITFLTILFAFFINQNKEKFASKLRKGLGNENDEEKEFQEI